MFGGIHWLSGLSFRWKVLQRTHANCARILVSHNTSQKTHTTLILQIRHDSGKQMLSTFFLAFQHRSNVPCFPDLTEPQRHVSGNLSIELPGFPLVLHVLLGHTQYGFLRQQVSLNSFPCNNVRGNSKLNTPTSSSFFLPSRPTNSRLSPRPTPA